MRELTHISLFAGIGGIDLATDWAGFETILFVEIDKYCQKVLNKHWPGVPIIGDIKDVTKEALDNAISRRFQASDQDSSWKEDNQRIPTKTGNGEHRTNREKFQPITLITGGFPCQPVSSAGKRKGEADDRWLWPEMLRVISEVRSTWVVAENVTGLLTMGFNDCLSDLESAGYETISFVIPACGVNAPHRRDRIFIVGYTEHPRWNGSEITGRFRERSDIRNGEEGQDEPWESTRPSSSIRRPEDVADTISQRGCSRNGERQDAENVDSRSEGISNVSNSKSNRTTGGGCQPDEARGWDWWAVEPDVGRVAYGIPSRVDRLRCLGNAVVPQQIYPILKAIAAIEKGQV